VLWTTKGYTPHAIAAHPDVPQFVIDRTQQALINFERTVRGMAMLHNMKIEGFEAAQDSDWNDVRALNINLLK
ncbi:MAG: PhnD/SsuA/transferrin family substrate-binding protein, partial [Gammaproteobacteria bacterium]|nr:PhnD/SsuA/transferrin family substrate-binding protein [Gammaproteobacteria bacterium]